MPSQNKQNIVFDSIKEKLIEVKFTKLADTTKKYKILLDNILTAKNVNIDGFVIEAKRILRFEPKGAFEILIVFNIECKLAQESKEFFKDDLDKLHKFIEKRKIELFNDLEVGNLMSILITQITMANNFKSIVVPPFITELEPKNAENL